MFTRWECKVTFVGYLMLSCTCSRPTEDCWSLVRSLQKQLKLWGEILLQLYKLHTGWARISSSPPAGKDCSDLQRLNRFHASCLLLEVLLRKMEGQIISLCGSTCSDMKWSWGGGTKRRKIWCGGKIIWLIKQRTKSFREVSARCLFIAVCKSVYLAEMLRAA